MVCISFKTACSTEIKKVRKLADNVAKIKSSTFSKTTLKIRIWSCHVSPMFLLLPVKK